MIDVMKNTGVYKLYYIGSDKFYVGSASQSFEKRLRVHLSELRNGKHHNRPLQMGYLKYGEGSLVMEPIVLCNPENCVEMEVLAINKLHPSYNASKVSNTRLGVKASEETRIKLSNSSKGKKLSEETKRKISESCRGNIKITEEHKEKLRMLMSGRVVSAETREKLRNANIGKKQSAETIMKRAVSMSYERNTNKYHFIHADGGEEYATAFEMKKKYDVGTHVYAVINGKRRSVKGWSLKNI
jgi:group I intron endonuclease